MNNTPPEVANTISVILILEIILYFLTSIMYAFSGGDEGYKKYITYFLYAILYLGIVMGLSKAVTDQQLSKYTKEYKIDLIFKMIAIPFILAIVGAFRI